jgi:DNA-directed RNA polymerase subunit N (RpoN/RPB10)
VLGDQFHWIASSRFGYLRSTFQEGATFDDQAHAYAYLLDQLGIKKSCRRRIISWRTIRSALCRIAPEASILSYAHLLWCRVFSRKRPTGVQKHIQGHMSE